MADLTFDPTEMRFVVEHLGSYNDDYSVERFTVSREVRELEPVDGHVVREYAGKTTITIELRPKARRVAGDAAQTR